jgi:hypothetical protein
LVSGDAIAYPVVLYFYTFLCHFQYSGIVVRAC